MVHPILPDPKDHGQARARQYWTLVVTPFFLTRVRAYASWIPVLTTHKAVNPGWVRTVCASLVKVPGEAATYRACVRGRELIISPAIVATALGIAPEEDYDYPVRFDHPVVSFDVITTTLSGGVQRSWTGELALSTECLTPDYHLLYLAIVACITPTATKKSLPGWMARVLYGVGTGQRICLVRLYIEMFAEPS